MAAVNDITLIQSILSQRGHTALAKLLERATSELVPLNQYGTAWNSFLVEYTIYAAVEHYDSLVNLPEEKRAIITTALRDLYPAQENKPEIHTLRIGISKEDTSQKTANKRLITSWVRRATIKLIEAKRLHQAYHYPEALSACQEALELFGKTLFLFTTGDTLKRHMFTSSDIKAVMGRLPTTISPELVATFYLHHHFWLQFYTIAKYGLEDIRVGPEVILTKYESELALHHAQNGLFLIEKIVK